ncbi:pyrimidine utilization protein D [Roseococcus sp. SDR]|uniref:pyrimidine utilization protein D n=1 Tax=Roseococcus sp. SDR TaxID=2835532 RepID=UPI001BCF851C|nr:pyrimidine utilization protein D [Roseococcus sp. SDR]MBV1846208.1 pyrimidine utilization protein D [Roseococcus sp. SDR]
MKFDLTGAGEEVVLLSAGLGGAAAFWAPQRAALEAKFRVLGFDQRGTGRNAEPLPDGYTIGHMADDVIAVMDAAGVSRVHVLGHALGGLVGLDLARRFPDRVGKLVLVNAWAKVDRHSERCFDIRIGILHSQGPAAYVAAQPLFLHTAPYMSANHEKISAEVAHGTAHFQGAENLLKRIGALRAFDARADLAQITAPTLVAASRDDLLVPWTASEALAAGLPHAELWVTPEGGHAFSVEQPEVFNPKLMEFLTA